MDKDLLKHPIRVPANPFWDVFKRFGRDEMIAMVMNVIGTALISWGLAGHKQAWFYATAIAVAGPIVEKVGFFPAHIKDAFEVYNSTPSDKRKPFLHYFINALKAGSVSLLEDILVHDPLYVVFMFVGIRLYPTTPAWLLATGSFIIALFGVAAGEVAVHEIRYWFYHRYLKSIGFERERYYEARFFIKSDRNPEEVLAKMSAKFDLHIKERGVYEDRYFLETKLPQFPARSGKFRLRHRYISKYGNVTEVGKVHSVQVVYRRTAEIGRSEVGQFRFFPQEKHKYYLVDKREKLHELLTYTPSLKRMVIEDSDQWIKFTRTIARNYPDGLFVSIDDVEVDRPFFLVELKVYKNLRLMKRAMRYIMREFPVIQTTYSKDDLLE